MDLDMFVGLMGKLLSNCDLCYEQSISSSRIRPVALGAESLTMALHCHRPQR
jgi:hypothetical protein